VDRLNVDIQMMGDFAVTVDGARTPAEGWRRRQAAALVKLLAVAPNRRLHRERVIDALWPELSVDEAAPRLHKAAFYARRALGVQDGVTLSDDSVVLLPSSHVNVDVFDFEDAAWAAERDGGPEAAAKALDLYGGELLPGDLYEPWCDELRERLRILYFTMLRQAERWEDLIAVDPADEEAHLALMRAHAEAGDRRAALRQFERMDRALRRELGVGPSAEALALRDELIATGVDAQSPEPAGLAGRGPELAELERVLDRADGGTGSTVFLSGVPGVGKTRLAEAVGERARARGWGVGEGVAAAIEGAWPYAPALESVADLVRHHPDLLDELPSEFRDAIDWVMSGRAVESSGESSQQRLFVATSEVVRLAARRHGVLLVVDDVHEADRASLRLLHYLARSLRRERVVIVLTYRPVPNPSLDELRASLLRYRAAVSIELQPFDLDATEAAVRAVRADAPMELVQEIHQVSGGLPLAVAELAARPGTVIGAPAALGEAVIASLAPQTRDALQRVAVVGSVFDTDEFVALCDLSDDEAYAQLDAALAAQVIVRVEAGFRFRHDVVRQALLERLPEHRRRAVHRDAAARLEALGGSPARVGHHLLRAGDVRAAVPFVRRAAEAETAMGAFTDARELVETVLPHAEGDDRAALLVLKADLLTAIGDRGAVPAYREALREATAENEPYLRARMGRAAVMAGDFASAAEAIDGLEPNGGPHDGLILVTRGMVAYFTGDIDSAAAAADEARARVARGERGWDFLDGVSLQSLVAHTRGEWVERIRFELQATRDSPELATSVFDSHLCVVEYLLYGPTPYDEIRQLADGLLRSAERSGALRAVAFARAVAGEAALLAGDLDTAETELRDAIEAHRDIGAQAGEAVCLQRLAEVHLARGEREAAVELLRESLAKARWSMLALHLLQRIFGTLIRAASDVDEARAVVDQAEAVFGDEDHCHFCQVMYSVPASIACADAGDLGAARYHLRRGEISAASWEGTSWQAALAEARAHIALAEGRADDAARLLAEAADGFELSGQPLDAARCRG
jgi:DNA-binding SARP family transcriptional activator